MKLVNYMVLGAAVVALTTGCNHTTTVEGVLTSNTDKSITLTSPYSEQKWELPKRNDFADFGAVRTGEVVKVEYTTTRNNRQQIKTSTVTSDHSADAMLAGVWIEQNPPIEGLVQGMALNANSRASSIGMATLLYNTWCRWDDRLVMTGKSLGNGQTIDFVESRKIAELTDNSLTLESENGQKTEYRRADRTESQQ